MSQILLHKCFKWTNSFFFSLSCILFFSLFLSFYLLICGKGFWMILKTYTLHCPDLACRSSSSLLTAPLGDPLTLFLSQSGYPASVRGASCAWSPIGFVRPDLQLLIPSPASPTLPALWDRLYTWELSTPPLAPSPVPSPRGHCINRVVSARPHTLISPSRQAPFQVFICLFHAQSQKSRKLPLLVISSNTYLFIKHFLKSSLQRDESDSC